MCRGLRIEWLDVQAENWRRDAEKDAGESHRRRLDRRGAVQAADPEGEDGEQSDEVEGRKHGVAGEQIELRHVGQ